MSSGKNDEAAVLVVNPLHGSPGVEVIKLFNFVTDDKSNKLEGF